MVRAEATSPRRCSPRSRRAPSTPPRDPRSGGSRSRATASAWRPRPPPR
jgi:hypothetical protein